MFHSLAYFSVCSFELSLLSRISLNFSSAANFSSLATIILMPAFCICFSLFDIFVDAINFNAINNEGNTGFHIVCANGEEKIVRTLLQNSSTTQMVIDEVRKISEVTVAHLTTGKFSIFCKIRAKDTMHAKEIIFKLDPSLLRMFAIELAHTDTSFKFSRVHSSKQLQLLLKVS